MRWKTLGGEEATGPSHAVRRGAAPIPGAKAPSHKFTTSTVVPLAQRMLLFHEYRPLLSRKTGAAVLQHKKAISAEQYAALYTERFSLKKKLELRLLKYKKKGFQRQPSGAQPGLLG